MEEELEMYIQQNQAMTATQEWNPVARFVHHHVLEVARDCLEQERDKKFTRAHSLAVTNNLQQLLTDTRSSKMEEELELYIQQNQAMTATQEWNPVARFVHHHVLEVARDCLEQERDKKFTRAHSLAVTNNLQQLLTDVKEMDKFAFDAVFTLIKRLKILLIVSRAHRLLESQKIGPEQVDVAEGQAKQTSKVDIISELGQSRFPITDDGDDVKDCYVNDVPKVEEYMLSSEVDEPINKISCTETEKNDFTEADQKIKKSKKRPRRLRSWVNNLQNVFAGCVGFNKVRRD